MDEIVIKKDIMRAEWKLQSLRNTQFIGKNNFSPNKVYLYSYINDVSGFWKDYTTQWPYFQFTMTSFNVLQLKVANVRAPTFYRKHN